MPNLPFGIPVIGCGSTVCGIAASAAWADTCQASPAANCGSKSLLFPGTLYSYGSRYTTGGVTKLPCGGGEGAAHSSVVDCHGFSAALGCRRLAKKFQMNGSCAMARPHADHEMRTLRLCTARPCA